MGLYEIVEFSKIRSIYLNRKIINISLHNTPNVIYRGADTQTHLQTHIY
jgi:hypothetical protein